MSTAVLPSMDGYPFTLKSNYFRKVHSNALPLVPSAQPTTSNPHQIERERERERERENMFFF